MPDAKGPSTRSLISDAESLRKSAKGGKKKGRGESTRQLVSGAEKLLGREQDSSAKGALGIVLLLVAVALAMGGYFFFVAG